jgi:protein SCO1/2
MKPKTTTLLLLTCILFAAMAASCDKKSAQNTSQTAAQSSAKRYHLKGKVVSVDKLSKMVNVDSEAIPGFMDAMTMPYQVKPEGELDKLHPGDAVAADVVVQDDSAWLENIAVTGHTAPGQNK